MKLWFENKVALVTGAGQGMGLAAARAFAEEGAAVALADRDEALVRRTCCFATSGCDLLSLLATEAS